MLAVGNDELGEVITPGQRLEPCKVCGLRHVVRDGNPPGILHFIKCRGKTFLIGIKGRRLPPPRNSNVTGT